jgi:tripartite-type tricarboxylate transporter receptor subunit TctC
LHLAAGAAALPAASRIAWAQAYPSRPVRVIVPFAPAGTTDIAARLMGQWLSERLGQQFVLENRPGASTTIGTEVVVRASADGYTLLLATTASAINTTLFEGKLNYNFLRDIVPIAGIFRVPNVMVVHPSVPGKTVPEFIAYAKANPRKLNMASPGTGSPPHLLGELFMMMTGTSMIHVPYRGSGPALIDLLAGQVQVGFDPLPASIEYVRAGRLRALAVCTRTASIRPLSRSCRETGGAGLSSWPQINADPSAGPRQRYWLASKRAYAPPVLCLTAAFDWIKT